VVVLRYLGRDELERDVAFQTLVACPVDDAHPAATDQLLDRVAEELRADPGTYRNGHLRSPPATIEPSRRNGNPGG
jgi:hypothetical protein